MNPAFTTRRAVVQDAAALASLRLALFRELGRNPPASHQENFERLSATAFEASLENGSCQAWLAEGQPGQTVGSLALLLYPRLPSPESPAQAEGYLMNVYTVPGWRRRGVAAALVQAAVARARDLGLGRLRLHATPEGQPVYAAAGFRSRLDEMELQLWEAVPNAG